jgi:hypothetical protein
MSEQPNQGPPPASAEYPRVPGTPIGEGSDRTPEKLEALASGYFALGRIWLATVVGFFIGIGVIFSTPLGANPVGPVYAFMFFVCALDIALAVSPIGKICFARNYSKNSKWFLALLFGGGMINFGVIAFIVMQILVAGEFQAYGVPRRFLGLIRRRDVRAVMDQMVERQTRAGA